MEEKTETTWIKRKSDESQATKTDVGMDTAGEHFFNTDADMGVVKHSLGSTWKGL